jgi:hypothetical protein
MPQRTSELTAAVRARAAERHKPEVSEAAAPVGHTGSGTGWSVQAGRLITNDDKA